MGIWSGIPAYEKRIQSCDHPYGAVYVRRWILSEFPFRCGKGGYYLNFLSDAGKVFFLNLGGSALAGYETVNWSDKILYDGATLKNGDAFVYGCALTLEMELYLADRVALTASLRERFLWGGSLGHCHTQYGIGIRFMIN